MQRQWRLRMGRIVRSRRMVQLLAVLHCQRRLQRKFALRRRAAGVGSPPKATTPKRGPSALEVSALGRRTPQPDGEEASDLLDLTDPMMAPEDHLVQSDASTSLRQQSCGRSGRSSVSQPYHLAS